MARNKKSKTHGKPDPVRVQVSIRVPDVPGVKGRITSAFLRKAVLQFVETGSAPRGITIDAIDWINPVRKNPELARWKSSNDPDQSMSGARKTLRRLLRRLKFNFQRVR